MSTYTTGEVAKLCGVSVRTVQYYDARGILTPSDLTDGGRRLYSDADLSKMKFICFLRELDISIDNISKILREENFEKVIALMLDEQRAQLEFELDEKKHKLEKLEELRKLLNKSQNFSVESLGDIAHVMDNKKKLKKLHATLLITGIPVSLLEWVTVILWILKGIWWPFTVYTAIAVVYGIWVSRYYFKHTAYICPECHEVFVPKFKEAFFASHTPTTRKLTCRCCKKKSYCVETYRDPGSKAE